MEHVASLEGQAIEFAKRGEFGIDAQRINEELTRLAPGNAGAWTRLARCCMELGQLDAAGAALDAALQLNPQNTIAHNLQLEVAKRRAGPAVAPPKARARAKATPRKTSARPTRTRTLPPGGFGRAEFAGLAHLEPAAAIDALARHFEALLMAINGRPFAGKVVEARNRAGHPGARLYRRSSLHPGGAGHVYAFQYGGRWEPQFNLGLFAASPWGRDALRAGIGFNLTQDGADPEREAGQERVLAYFARFQQLVSSEWRQLLTAWLRANGGFIQYGDGPPATDLLPDQAVSWLVNSHNARELGWIFCGRWLFADQPDEAAVLADGARLIRWIDQTFTDLLPLWTAVYRG